MSVGKQSVGHPVDVASGTVYSTHLDYRIPGKVDLTWERRYSTSLLDQPASPLGRGWASRYFATLTRLDGEYRFVTPEGEVESFLDPAGEVERGGIVRNLPTSQELLKVAGAYHVVRWDADSEGVERFVFAEGRPGEPWPLRSIEDVTGQGLDLIRDKQGRILEIQQRLEKRAFVIEYTAEGRVQQISFAPREGERQVLVRFEYDRTGMLSAAFDARGFADRYEYDEAGRITREVVKDGGVFSFRYDENGRCAKTWGVDGYDEKSLKYHEASGWTEVTDSTGAKSRYQCSASGQVLQFVDPLGNVQQTEYDEFGRIVAMIDPTEAVTAFEFDELGNRSAVVTPSGSKYQLQYNAARQQTQLIDPAGGVWRREYDSANRLVATFDPLGSRTAYAYDSSGNLASVEAPTGARRRYYFTREGVLEKVANWSGEITRLVYDGYGRLTERADAMRRTIRMQYDAMGNMIHFERQDGSQVKMAHDAGGNLISATESNGRTLRYQYGPCRRLLTQTGVDGSQVKYHWGTEPGRLECIVNENGDSYSVKYDVAGRNVRVVGFDGSVQQFEYDKAGRRAAITNGVGERISFVYAPGGALQRVQLPDGAVQSYERDKLGNLVGVKNGDIAVEFQRDVLGRITQEIQGEFEVRSQFDALGNRTRLATSLGHEAAYDVDANGALAQLNFAAGSIRFERNAVGQELLRATSHGVEFTHEYDERSGRLVRQQVRAGTVAVADRGKSVSGTRALERTYGYQPGGALTAVRDSRFGTLENQFDDRGRLTHARWSNGTEESFAYDVTSNLVAVGFNSTANRGMSILPRDEALSYGPGGRLQQQGDSSFEFDAQGRLIRKIVRSAVALPQEWQFTWDALDQLRSVRCPDDSIWTYAYDGLGRRISKTGPDGVTRYVWDGDVVVHEQVRDRAPDTWVFDPGSYKPLCKIEHNELHTVLTDQLGTPQAIYDERGALAWSGQYRAWGAMLAPPEEKVKCNPRFQGQWFDEETGLHYNMFRYYDPQAGRYLSSDPIGLQGGMNLFAYVPDPTRWIDPLGLSADLELGQGWTGRVDTFTTSIGADHEVHVYRPNGSEAGIHGSEGWFAKHGHPASAPPDIPEGVANTVRDISIGEARRAGLIPEKGRADVTGDKWKEIVQKSKEKKEEEKKRSECNK